MKQRTGRTSDLWRRAASPILTALVLLGLFATSCAKTQLNDSTLDEGLLTEISFRLCGPMIMTEVKVDDSAPLVFIFDTGAGGTVINERTAKELGIVGDETVSRVGGTGMVSVATSKNHVVGVEDIRLEKATVGIADLSAIERRTGCSIDGIIGWPLLSRYAVRVNYDSMRIEIYDNDRFRYDLGTSFLDLDVSGTAIFADVSVAFDSGTAFTGRVLVDTGFGGTFSFCKPFAEENDLLGKSDSYYERETAGLGSQTSTVYTTMLAGIGVCDYSFSALPGNIAFAEEGALSWPGVMGILGNEVLKRFNLFIDLRQRRMYLEPNGVYQERFEIDCSGLELTKDNVLQRVIVSRVYAGSSAEEAGVEIGDEIVQIDGILVSQMQMHEVRGMLSQDGKDVEILVSRADQPQTYLLRLRSMLR